MLNRSSVRFRDLVTGSSGLLAGWSSVTHSAVAYLVVGASATVLLPPTMLLAGAVVTSGGGTQTQVLGPLLAADLLFIAWLARCVITRQPTWPAGLMWVGLAIGGFLAWSLFATSQNAAEISPLLRLTVYAAVMVTVAVYGVHERLLYSIVLGFALYEGVGGALLGQDRLTGTLVGDPAQMGALLLAAGIPLVTGDLRFPGWWLLPPVLLFGIWLTETRSVWFASIVVAVVWLLRSQAGRARTLLAIAVTAAVGFQLVGVVTERLGLNADSGVYRISSIMNGVNSGLLHPWIGSGWASVETVLVGGVLPYNLFVNVFAGVGAPALCALLIFLWSLLGQLAPRRRAPFYFVVVVLAMSLTEMTLYAGSLLTVLFFVYAGMGLHQSSRKEATLSMDREGTSKLTEGSATDVGGSQPDRVCR